MTIGSWIKPSSYGAIPHTVLFLAMPQGAPSQGAPSQGTPSQSTPSQGSPSQGVPSQGAPSLGAPAQGAPSQSILSQCQSAGFVLARMQTGRQTGRDDFIQKDHLVAFHWARWQDMLAHLQCPLWSFVTIFSLLWFWAINTRRQWEFSLSPLSSKPVHPIILIYSYRNTSPKNQTCRSSMKYWWNITSLYPMWKKDAFKLSGKFTSSHAIGQSICRTYGHQSVCQSTMQSMEWWTSDLSEWDMRFTEMKVWNLWERLIRMSW